MSLIQSFRNLKSLVQDSFNLMRHNMFSNTELNILNDINEQSDLNVDDSQVSAEIDVKLQKFALRLQGEYLSSDGQYVDYGTLKTSPAFIEFQKDVSNLRLVDLDQMTGNRLKAFFINVYNILTIHGIAVSEPLPRSVIEVGNFWKKTAYSIGGSIFSLDDIEHGILRCNKKHPTSLFPQFGGEDVRRKYSLGSLDPRIHFALNCGAKSCPAIRVYTEANIDQALDMAATNFVKNEVEIIENEIKLSKIFQWYASDFGESKKEILSWIAKYLSENEQKTLSALIESNSYKIVYKDYDWSLNLK